MSDWLIETQNLTKTYGHGENIIYALDDVNLCVAPGELLTVMGPSGSGKSTLLNMLGALDIPTSGTVRVNGQDIAKLRNKDQFRAKTVGFVFQLHNLIPTLTARENIEIPMMGHYSRRERSKRSKELLEVVGLGDRMGHLPNQLSGGQRQRVAVARALANEPPLVLADEPTGSLDTNAGTALLDLIHELNQTRQTTFVMVTHDPAVARRTNRVVVMQDGAIVREDHIGSPLEEDLKMWRHSGLGKQIVNSTDGELDELGIRPDEVDAVRDLLRKVES